MTTDLNQFMDTHKELLNEQLLLKISELEAPPKLKDAMSYSLKAGEKESGPFYYLLSLSHLAKIRYLGFPPPWPWK